MDKLMGPASLPRAAQLINHEDKMFACDHAQRDTCRALIRAGTGLPARPSAVGSSGILKRGESFCIFM